MSDDPQIPENEPEASPETKAANAILAAAAQVLEEHKRILNVELAATKLLNKVWSRTLRIFGFIAIGLLLVVIVEVAVLVCLINVQQNQQATIMNEKVIAEAYNAKLQNVGSLLGVLTVEETSRLTGNNDFTQKLDLVLKKISDDEKIRLTGDSEFTKQWTAQQVVLLDDDRQILETLKAIEKELRTKQ